VSVAVHSGTIPGLLTAAAERDEHGTWLRSERDAGVRKDRARVPAGWLALPRTPTARIAKHRLPGGHPPGEWDAEVVGGQEAKQGAERQ
jgi:hypothetical protein